MASSVSWRLAARGFGLALTLVGFGAACGAAKAAGASMTVGGPTTQPVGHFDFCKTHAAECSIRSPNSKPEHLTNALLRRISSVNKSVNTRVKPMEDIDHYGKDEVWAYPDDGYGDCEDYVLEKRRTLAKSGVAVANLLITVVRKRNGEGHSVLTIRTDRGDIVLDNLSDKVLLWNQTGYRYMKRQSSENTGRWVSIRGGDEALVSSVQ